MSTFTFSESADSGDESTFTFSESADSGDESTCTFSESADSTYASTCTLVNRLQNAKADKRGKLQWKLKLNI